MNKKAGAGIVVIIILAVLVIGGGGYYYYSISSNPKIISENTEIVLSCVDSDGNDIYTKGYTSYERQEPDEISLYQSEDICNYFHAKTESGVGLVREMWCEGNTLKEVLSTCGKGFVCRQGKCVEGGSNLPVCQDTDGGKEINERGEIYGYGGSGRDECWMYALEGPEQGEGGYTNECEGDNCYVYEYYCDGDSKAYEIIACENGCENGACF